MAFLRRIWNKWQNLLHDEKLKHKIYVIIFESDTPMGKLFDVALIGFIVLSILVVIAESIKSWYIKMPRPNFAVTANWV